MTNTKQQEIVKWMCKLWDFDDIFDEAVNHFGKTKDVINFCASIEKKLDKALVNLPKYLEREMKK